MKAGNNEKRQKINRMQKQHKLTGIVRNIPESVGPDFSCTEMINLREKNGVWRATGAKETVVDNNPLAGSKKYIINENCTACGACVANCPNEAIIYNSPDNRYDIDQTNCIKCGNCYVSCNYNTVAYEYLFEDNKKIQLFLHTTGETKQMIAFVNGSMQYFDFPGGQTVTTIWNLPEADADRTVRFNAVGNILVIFVERLPPTSSEGGEGKTPYTKYAIWKAGADNVKRYYLLPDLPAPALEFGLQKRLLAGGGLTGYGLLTAAYHTIDGHYIRQQPPLLFNYGDEDGDYGRTPVFLRKKNVQFIPTEWEGIIDAIAVFSTPPQTGIDKYTFDKYLADEGKIFYKIFDTAELLPRPARTLVTGLLENYYTHETDGPDKWFTIPVKTVIAEEALPAVLKFGNQNYYEGTGILREDNYLFYKSGEQPVSLHIVIKFLFNLSFSGNPINCNMLDLRLVAYNETTNLYHATTLKAFAASNPPTVTTVSETISYDGIVEITKEGYYYLVLQWGTPQFLVKGEVALSVPEVCSFSYNPRDESDVIVNYLHIPDRDVLKTRTALLLSECINHDLYGHCEMNYNARLFLGDTTSLLFKGYSPEDYGGEDDSFLSLIEQCYVVYLRTEDGEKVVRSDWSSIYRLNLGTSRYYLKWTTLISYPDYRAYKAVWYLRKSGKIYKFREYDLTANKDGNYAYYYVYAFDKLLNEETLLPTTLRPKTVAGNDYGVLLPEATSRIPSDLSTWDIEETTLPDTDNTVHSVNNTAVSALHLPMFYPAKYYNIVGNKRVVGFSANSLAIDAGNFGVYPVFVFSENGVYAMELGTGDVLVTRIVPLSGDVCIERDSITNIGGATLFASRDGLRILQGQRSQKLTAMLENYTGNPLSGNRHFEAILTKYGWGEFISGYGDFQAFLSGAKTYLHYKENEVVVTNETFPYSYVLYLPKATEGGGIRISKISERYYNILNDYPNAYGTNASGQVIYNIGSEQSEAGSSGKQEVFVQTNAFKLGTDEFEVIRRLIVRIRLGVLTEGQQTGAYLFASNDTRKWAWVDGCEITAQNAPQGAQNFAPLRYPASMKYGILVIAGSIDRVMDSLTHVSVDYEKRYENKIR
jgi:ferredoxin